jgi:WD40 repeat protein
MAPEQWRGEASTPASDIWALGVVLHELAVGRLPYPQRSLDQLVHLVTSDLPVPPIESAEMTPQLNDLIRACLSKDPAARPLAAAIVQTLEHLLSQKHPASEDASPFRGLLAFTEQHAEFFFGREAEVDAFLERLRERPVLPIVGLSGAGKSSFVQAGVVPRLREQGAWTVLAIRPGGEPFLALAQRLLGGERTSSFRMRNKTRPLAKTGAVSADESGVGKNEPSAEALAQLLSDSPEELARILREIAENSSTRVLLFVDQLEEAYTHCANAALRERFFHAVCAAADDEHDPVRVCFTLRDDFLGRLAEGAESVAVREALNHVIVLRSPSKDALREILTRPSQAAGYRYDDPSLVDDMLKAIASEPAGLPLLQFAVRMLWDKRDKDRRILSRAAYDAIGGVAGALAEHAEAVLAGLSPEQAKVARQMFLRLVTPQRTRHVMRADQLVAELGPSAPELLDRFTRARLLNARKSSRREAELELAHESLISRWARLSSWVDEGREELAFVAEISRAAELWAERGRRADEVWRGDALRDAQRKRELLRSPLSEVSVAFLAAGERVEAQHVRRRRILNVGAGAALGLVALVAVAVAVAMSDKEASAQRRWAEAQREGARAALGRGDPLQARAMLRGSLEVDDALPARGLWAELDAEPLQLVKQAGAEILDVAFDATGSELYVTTVNGNAAIELVDLASFSLRTSPEMAGARVVRFGPENRRAVFGSYGRVSVVDRDAGTVTVLRAKHGSERAPSGHNGRIADLAMSGDGRLALSGGFNEARLWNLQSLEEQAVLPTHRGTVFVALNADGARAITTDAEHIRVWQTRPLALQRTLDGHAGVVLAVALRDDGVLASAGQDGVVRLWNVETGSLLAELRGHRASINALAFHDDLLASVSEDGTLRAWSVEKRELLTTIDLGVRRRQRVAISPDGSRIATSSGDMKARVWSVEKLLRRRRLLGGEGYFVNLAVSPDGALGAGAGGDAVVRVWDLVTGGPKWLLPGHEGFVSALSFSPDIHLLASGSHDGTIRIWNMQTGREDRTLREHADRTQSVAFSPDGKLFVSQGPSALHVWETATWQQRRVIAGVEPAPHLLFSQDSGLVFAGGQDKILRAWRSSDWSLVHALPTPGQAYKLALQPGGNMAAVACSDGSVALCDLRTGTSKTIGPFDYNNRLNSGAEIAFSPDGNTLFVPSSTRLHSYDVASGQSVSRAFEEVYAFDAKVRVGVLSSQSGAIIGVDMASGLPRARGAMVLRESLTLVAGRGWRDLATGRLDTAPRDKAWQRALADEAVVGAQSEDGRVLCVVGADRRFAVWDRDADRAVATEQLAAKPAVIGSARGCVRIALNPSSEIGRLIQPAEARLFEGTGASRVVHPAATAATFRDGELALATVDSLVVLDEQGAERERLPNKTVVTALGMNREWLATGDPHGNVRLIPRRGRNANSVSFSEQSSRQVTALLFGPSDTLFIGWADGVVGGWSLLDGRRLESARIYGEVRHFRVAGPRLYAASDVGDFISFDLRPFERDYCTFLRTVWQDVPVVWELGGPVVRPAPTSHRCAR